MKNILIYTIRITAIAIVALFAGAQDVFAAPVLTPVSVARTETVITLTAKMTNLSWNNTTVWYEWGEDTANLGAIGMGAILQEGFFETKIRDFKPGTTYYFRAAAMEGGVTIYSPMQSLVTTGGSKVAVVASTVNTNTATNNTTANKTTKIINNTETNTTNTSNSTTDKSTTKASSVVSSVDATKKSTNTTTGSSQVGTSQNTYGTNANTASVIGVGGSMVPSTLIGWLALLIAILVMILLTYMIFESSAKRKKAREEARILRNQALEMREMMVA